MQSWVIKNRRSVGLAGIEPEHLVVEMVNGLAGMKRKKKFPRLGYSWVESVDGEAGVDLFLFIIMSMLPRIFNFHIWDVE